MASRRTYTITRLPDEAKTDADALRAAKNNYSWAAANDYSVRTSNYFTEWFDKQDQSRCNAVVGECCPIQSNVLMVRYYAASKDIDVFEKEMKAAGFKFKVKKGG